MSTQTFPCVGLDERSRTDKEREAMLGFDGTWVGHPDVVGVALAAFDEVLGQQPNQIVEQVALQEDFPEFLTLVAYELLD
jgi:malate synthase